ncbi:response regulator transcription factor [Thalassobacillus pellis]|uniref:response regulator transcription factor n=1 Tax=Thalassobacillus pellis TaxID=748008 RepID=UPI001961FF3B|nr:response regulator transcription factor [Thalassobacillus pellis]MBM7553859.1 DNA-binding response OmpR family regulator [Thalassobacillus pellis]
MKRIYIIEDDRKTAFLLSDFLQSHGFDTYLTKDFDNIRQEFLNFAPHLVLISVSLPKSNGYYWARQIRTLSICPIIFLSDKYTVIDQVTAIENGGDDYLMKPLKLNVVLSKLTNNLNRVYGENKEEKPSNTLICEGIELDLNTMVLKYDGKSQTLTKKEFILMKEFLRRPNLVLSRKDLIELLWESQNEVDANTLSVNVTRVRKKLSKLGIHKAILTVRGEGYQFIPVRTD